VGTLEDRRRGGRPGVEGGEGGGGEREDMRDDTTLVIERGQK
jgi:hypothetical protein